MSKLLPPDAGIETLIEDVRSLIDAARRQVAGAVNTTLTRLYWQIGQRVRTALLAEAGRAAYGEQIVATLSRQLTNHYGKGFNKSALNRMLQFAGVFPDAQIVATLSQELSWSHFLLLLPLDKPMQRDFYAEMCRVERWSVRTLSAKINGMLYERTALSHQPDTLIRHELKLGDFKPADKGQMELYLRWLDKHERQPGESAPLGLILCAGKKREVVELLELEKSSIHVAEYLTALPPREVLERKLQEAVANARGRLLAAKGNGEAGV